MVRKLLIEKQLDTINQKRKYVRIFKTFRLICFKKLGEEDCPKAKTTNKRPKSNTSLQNYVTRFLLLRILIQAFKDFKMHLKTH